MALFGSLKEMSVADLIQHNCQDRKAALLTIEHDGKKMQMYFKDGNIVHAAMGPISGEEAVYQALAWEDGKFVLEIGVQAPVFTINRSWSSLLLEGAKRQDERQSGRSFLEADGAGRKEHIANDVLISFLTNSKVFSGAIVAETTGKVISACIENPDQQETLVSVGVAMASLSRRSLRLINSAPLNYSVFQGQNGCILISMVNPTTMVLATTPGKPEPHTLIEEISKVSADLAHLFE